MLARSHGTRPALPHRRTSRCRSRRRSSPRSRAARAGSGRSTSVPTRTGGPTAGPATPSTQANDTSLSPPHGNTRRHIVQALGRLRIGRQKWRKARLGGPSSVDVKRTSRPTSEAGALAELLASDLVGATAAVTDLRDGRVAHAD